MRLLWAVLLVLYFSTSAAAVTEKEYQDYYCIGEKEVVLDNRTRVDCVTSTHAIEIDFGRKWAEAYGQALYYAAKLEKTPGIYIIIKDANTEGKYLARLLLLIKTYGPEDINIWTIHGGRLSLFY